MKVIKSIRIAATTILGLAWFCSVAAQDRSPFTKSYEDVRFKIWYMHWRPKSPPLTPFRHDGEVVVVFFSDGVLRLPSGARQERHAGDAAYFEPGSIATAGELVTDRPLNAVVIELKDVPPARPMPPTSYPPAFPRSGTTKVFENARTIIWDSLMRPDDPAPLHLHDKNSVQVWVSGAVINRGHPNQPTRQAPRSVGAWEMTHGGYVDSEQVVGTPARLVTVEHK